MWKVFGYYFLLPLLLFLLHANVYCAGKKNLKKKIGYQTSVPLHTISNKSIYEYSTNLFIWE